MSQSTLNDVKVLQKYFEDENSQVPKSIRDKGLRVLKTYETLYSTIADLKTRQKNVMATLRRLMGITPSKESPPSDQQGGVFVRTTERLPKKWGWWNQRQKKSL